MTLSSNWSPLLRLCVRDGESASDGRSSDISCVKKVFVSCERAKCATYGTVLNEKVSCWVTNLHLLGSGMRSTSKLWGGARGHTSAGYVDDVLAVKRQYLVQQGNTGTCYRGYATRACFLWFHPDGRGRLRRGRLVRFGGLDGEPRPPARHQPSLHHRWPRGRAETRR